MSRLVLKNACNDEEKKDPQKTSCCAAQCLFRKHEWYGCEKEKIPKRGKDDVYRKKKKLVS